MSFEIHNLRIFYPIPDFARELFFLLVSKRNFIKWVFSFSSFTGGIFCRKKIAQKYVWKEIIGQVISSRAAWRAVSYTLVPSQVGSIDFIAKYLLWGSNLTYSWSSGTVISYLSVNFVNFLWFQNCRIIFMSQSNKLWCRQSWLTTHDAWVMEYTVKFIVQTLRLNCCQHFFEINLISLPG